MTFEKWWAGLNGPQTELREEDRHAAYVGWHARDAEIDALRKQIEATRKIVTLSVACTCEARQCTQPDCGEWHERRNKHCAHHNLLAALDAPFEAQGKPKVNCTCGCHKEKL